MTNMDNVKEFLMPAPHEPGKWESFGLGIVMGALVTKMGYELAPIVKRKITQYRLQDYRKNQK